jgi:4-hydroxy-3-methylbut-2-enyl diphosphate reductase
VTSGASVPEELVTQVLERLGAAGFAQVEIRSAVEEKLTFALPPEARRLG